MKSAMFLRIASVLTLVHSALHTMGGVFGKPVPGVAAATEAVMRTNYFQVLGETRSYWEFLHGMGLAVTIFLSAEGIALWMLGSLARNDAAKLRPILSVFLVAYLFLALNSYTYFFLGPVIAEILIAGCLLGAIATAKPAVATQPAALRAAAQAGD